MNICNHLSVPLEDLLRYPPPGGYKRKLGVLHVDGGYTE
jgi:hypothetical protein